MTTDMEDAVVALLKYYFEDAEEDEGIDFETLNELMRDLKTAMEGESK